MCGLAGKAVIGKPALPQEAHAQLRRMSVAVAHRGPDGERILVDGPVGLVFRRLALVDPASGDQPMFDEQKTVALIANGEVYNHRDLEKRFPPAIFRTSSDCEILAHLYARDKLHFLDDVRGMFAIVLYDRPRNRLVFARDRFGIKPLYFARCGDAVLFASEIKALFSDPACPRELDWHSALADQSLHAAPFFTSAPVNTWFRGIEIVPAGTIVTIDLATGNTTRHSYWQLPDFAGDNAAASTQIATTYRELLASSVEDCVSADAEVGLFLSGGIDSSAVAALAAPHQKIHTFTVLNGSTFVNGDAESAFQVAQALRLPNHQVFFPAGRIPAPEEWKRLLWLLETPLCGPEQYYKYELYRYVKSIRPELKGMMLGQASDEFNGGYSVPLSGESDWAGFRGALTEMAQTRALHELPFLSAWRNHHDALVISDEVLRDSNGGMFGDPYQAFVNWKYRDIQQYNCWHEDRTAAGNGVEARVPFLDHRIVELMAAIPAPRRADLLWDKAVLREAVRDIVPPTIATRPKVSFYHGNGAQHTHRTFIRMLSQDGGNLLEQALAAPGARHFLRPGAVRSFLHRLQQAPAPGNSEFILRLVNLGLLDQMVRDLPAPPVEAPRAALAPAVRLSDSRRGRDELASRLSCVRQPSAEDVIGFGDEVLLLQAPSEPGVVYIAVEGRLEYVIDAREDTHWHAFLTNIDGQRTLAAILRASGAALEEISDLLRSCVEDGLLTHRPAETPLTRLGVAPQRPVA